MKKYNPEEGLSKLKEIISSLNLPHLFNSILNQEMDDYQVFNVSLAVKKAHLFFRGELAELVRFSQGFNQQYATDNNQCFETASNLLCVIRDSVCSPKDLFRSVRAFVCHQLKEGGEAHDFLSTFARSVLDGTYCKKLFQLVSNPEFAMELYHELAEFFCEIVAAIKFCQKVREEEQAIRNNPDRCLAIYNNSCEEVFDSLSYVLPNFEMSTSLAGDVIFKDQQQKQFKDFICEGFHKYDRNQFFAYVVKLKMLEDQEGMTLTEMTLWGDDADKARDARYVVSHFDELHPEGHKGKLDAKMVAMFMDWCNFDPTVSDTFFVEKYFNPSYKGKYKTVRNTSVNMAKGHKVRKEDQMKFNRKIEELLADADERA